MTASKARVFSDMPIPPGEVLEEELEARGMTQKELAARLGRPPQVINEIIRAKKAITPETAIGLANVLGIDAQFWINLESDYRMTMARNRERDMLLENVQWPQHYPIREMIERGWMEAGRDKPDRVKALLRFLGVSAAEPRVYQEAVGFRISEAGSAAGFSWSSSRWLRKTPVERAMHRQFAPPTTTRVCFVNLLPKSDK